MNPIEYVSIAASLLIIAALIPKNKPILFRILNMIGSILFVIYGVLMIANQLKSGYALAILNTLSAIVSAIHLIRLNKERKNNDKH